MDDSLFMGDALVRQAALTMDYLVPQGEIRAKDASSSRMSLFRKANSGLRGLVSSETAGQGRRGVIARTFVPCAAAGIR